MSLLPIMMWLNILSSPPPTARPADVLRRGGHYDEVRLARNTWSVSDRDVRRDSLSGQAALAPLFADCMVWHAQAPHATVTLG